jgi:hypothetical protein
VADPKIVERMKEAVGSLAATSSRPSALFPISALKGFDTTCLTFSCSSSSSHIARFPVHIIIIIIIIRDGVDKGIRWLLEQLREAAAAAT